MTDREKLEKVLEFVTKNEDRFYNPIEEGKYEPGSFISGFIISKGKIFY